MAKVHTIQEFLNCLGFYGFGGGWVAAQPSRRREDGSIYCDHCPLGQDCWTKHLERTRLLLPCTSAVFDEIAERHGEDVAATFSEWAKVSKTTKPGDAVPDPYLFTMMYNMEAGAAVALGKKPKDSGRFSLTWPLSATAWGVI